MKGSQKSANESNIAGMGGYGVKAYDGAGKVSALNGLHICCVQATTETEISTVEAAWDAPADVDGTTIAAGGCLFLRAKSVTFISGSGFVYYGNGQVVPGGE